MTAPTLPDTLRALAKSIPERVEYIHEESQYVHCWGTWQKVKRDIDLPEVEYALREEIKAREWLWRTWALAPGHGYAAEVEQGVLARTTLEYATSPAHALGLALLAALERGES